MYIKVKNDTLLERVFLWEIDNYCRYERKNIMKTKESVNVMIFETFYWYLLRLREKGAN